MSEITISFGNVMIFIMGAFLLGAFFGVILTRSSRKAVRDSFKKGEDQGRKQEADAAQKEREELALSLATQFGEMRDGLIQTVHAYKRAVESCGEKLAIPQQELLALTGKVHGSENDQAAEVVELAIDTDQPEVKQNLKHESCDQNDSSQPDVSERERSSASVSEPGKEDACTKGCAPVESEVQRDLDESQESDPTPVSAKEESKVSDAEKRVLH